MGFPINIGQFLLHGLLIELVAQPVDLLLELPELSAPRKVCLRQLRASHRVFVKGMYTEDEDVKEGEDAEPLR
jgi:hypothetical protein